VAATEQNTDGSIQVLNFDKEIHEFSDGTNNLNMLIREKWNAIILQIS
jgi:hypothetical protein